MSHYRPPYVPDMDRWTTEQALAVYDLCQMINASLETRFGNQLVEKLIELNQQHTQGKSNDEGYCTNLHLPFEDLD